MFRPQWPRLRRFYRCQASVPDWFLALPTDGLIGSSHTGRRHIGSGRVPSAGVVIKHVRRIRPGAAAEQTCWWYRLWPAPSKQQHCKGSFSRPLSYHLKMIVDTNAQVKLIAQKCDPCSGARAWGEIFAWLNMEFVCFCHVQKLRSLGLYWNVNGSNVSTRDDVPYRHLKDFILTGKPQHGLSLVSV